MSRVIERSIVFWLAAALFAFEATGEKIEFSKHNLGASSFNQIRAAGAVDMCTICHGKHNSFPRAAKWDSSKQGVTYIPYTSSTMSALPGQPTGSSLMCLSCHDGTTAKGGLLSGLRDSGLQAGIAAMAGRSNLGVDLSDDHPVSFTYFESYAGNPDEYVHPEALARELRLDGRGQMQCTSCHDPHDDSYGNFLRVPNQAGELCLECHTKSGWDSSAHGLELVGQPGLSIPASGCETCHVSHSAGSHASLLRFEQEEENCYVCHNSRSRDSDIESESRKPYGHPAERTTGLHDAAEPIVAVSPHVECTDCHNPHAAQRSSTGSQNVVEYYPSSDQSHDLPSALIGVAGVDILSGEIPRSQGVLHEYQVCFRCHGEYNGFQSRVERQFTTTNTMAEFSQNAMSHHPVVTAGRNDDVPSLVQPLTENSLIRCTDCHNNDDAQGPRGPHGSIYQGLLEYQYLTQDGTRESFNAYALCYKCHERDSILRDDSFSSHSLHVKGTGSFGMDSGTSCSTCHDPHASEQSRLINFDINTVLPSASGRLEYFSDGNESGGCYLSCHGKDHDPICYDRSGTADC